MYGPWGWCAVGMTFGWLLFLALVVVGVVLVVRSFSGRGRTADRSSDGRALDILDERFARGELDQKDYDERRRILSGGR